MGGRLWPSGAIATLLLASAHQRQLTAYMRPGEENFRRIMEEREQESGREMRQNKATFPTISGHALHEGETPSPPPPPPQQKSRGPNPKSLRRSTYRNVAVCCAASYCASLRYVRASIGSLILYGNYCYWELQKGLHILGESCLIVEDKFSSSPEIAEIGAQI